MKPNTKRRGRPKKGSAERKTESLLLKMDAREKAGFVAAADLAGASLSAWMRERLRVVAASELQRAGRDVPFLG